MVHYSLNILLWMMLDDIWGFSIGVQRHIYNQQCNTSLAERFIRKQENVSAVPHSSGVQSRRSAEDSLGLKG